MRVLDNASVKADAELAAEASDKRAAARKAMDDAVRRAFQHLIYLGRGENGEGRSDKTYRFEHDLQSALDGTVVWTKLKELGKAVDPFEFGAKALLHNLVDADYGRPLDEIRDRSLRSVSDSGVRRLARRRAVISLSRTTAFAGEATPVLSTRRASMAGKRVVGPRRGTGSFDSGPYASTVPSTKRRIRAK